MCGGMGHYEETKINLVGKIHSVKIEKLDSNHKKKLNLKQRNTPSYIINNARSYNQKTFENLLQFLETKIDELNLNKSIQDKEIRVTKLNDQIKSIREILKFNLYGIDEKTGAKNKNSWIIFEKENKKKNAAKKINLKKGKEKKSKEIKIIRSTIGDIFKLGLVKPLKK